jgi:hypothetical protein
VGDAPLGSDATIFVAEDLESFEKRHHFIHYFFLSINLGLFADDSPFRFF